MSGGSDRALVVIGSGLSGYTFIRQLRELDKEREIILITGDGGEVYSKPLLSNALAKQQTPETLVQKTGEQKAEELGITLMSHCRAESIDRAARVVHTDRGDVAYGDLVLAVGASQRVILPEGAQPEWVDTVNSLDDYRRWYAKLDGARRVLLIGAGLIGCEFADDLMSRGIAVDLVDPAPWPLVRLLPREAGEALAQAFRESGAALHCGHTVASLSRRDDGGFVGQLDDGTEVAADLVLSAVGLVPQTALAREAGLETDQGIVVDARLQTSDSHIYAMGDCAQTPAGVLPYILPLMAQARALAQIVAGRDVHLTMRAMPVIVKTTSLPVVVCPPPARLHGEWHPQGEGRHWEAVFHDEQGAPSGFALTGDALSRKGALTKLMPPALA